MFKLILGLGNQDIETSKKIAYIYSQSNIDIIDSSFEVFKEIKKFLEDKSIDTSKIKFCVSVGLLGDIHNKKAKINKNCAKCKKCISFCSQKAIEITNEEIKVNSKKCIGCSKCRHFCSFGAIDIYEENSLENNIEQIKNNTLKPDILELHLDIKKKKKIIKDFEYVLKNYKGDISICISRKYFGIKKIIKLIKKLKEIFDKYNKGFHFMIQADGSSMNNADGEYSSNLEALAFYKELSDLGYDIIISGGTNDKTPYLCKLFNLKPYAVAYGSYARKTALGDEKKAQELVLKTAQLYD